MVLVALLLELTVEKLLEILVLRACHQIHVILLIGRGLTQLSRLEVNLVH